MSEINDKTADTALAYAPALSPETVVKGALLFLAFLLAYSTPIFLLTKEWNEPDFSHGVLVPFVSLYFVWIERGRLKGLPARPDYVSGTALILAAGLMLMIGRTGRMAVAQEASILLAIPGLVLLLLGRRHMRVLVLPIAYLAFMVPLMNPFIDKIHWPFQIFTAKFASVLLPYMGVPVYQRMNFLELPNITLEVAKGCSGVKFMVSIYATAIPLAYFTLTGRMRKALLMVLAFIIGVVTNGLRVSLIGVWTYYHLGNALHGPYHLLQGYFVALVGFVFLFIASVSLGGKRAVPPPAAETGDVLRRQGSYTGSRAKSAWLMAMAFLLGMGWYMHLVNPSLSPINKPLARLPFSLGDWRGEDEINGISPVRLPGATEELTRLYRNGSGREAILYIGYLDSQMKGNGLINDYFNDYYEHIEEVKISDIGGTLSLNKKIMMAGGRDYEVLFWYDLDGRALTGPRRVKLETAFNGLVRGRTNGAVIMVMSELKDRDNPEEVLLDEAALIQALKPLLRGYFSFDGGGAAPVRASLLTPKAVIGG